MSVGAHWTDRLLDVGQLLAADVDQQAVLDQVLETARELTGARYAALGVLNERRDGLATFVTRGVDEEAHRAIGHPPRGRGVLGDLIADPRPVRLPDIARHPAGDELPPGHPPMASFLGVPIMIDGRAGGNLYVTEKRDGEFTDDDERALVILAGWAAIAIQRARSGDGDDRLRWAWQLHAGTLQSLIGLRMLLAGAARRELDLPQTRAALGGAAAEVQVVIDGLRELIANLRSAAPGPPIAGREPDPETTPVPTAAPASAPRARARARSQTPPAYVTRFVDALRVVDGREAEAVARDAMDAGLELAAVYARVIAPAMYRIGELWARGVITVADEHAATAIAHNVLAAANQTARDLPPLGRTVLLAAPEGERHTLGLRMAADVFEQERYHVIYLGADIPADSLVQSVAGHRPALTGLSLTIQRPDRQITGLLGAIRQAHPDTHILIGGQGVPERRFQDDVSFVATVESLVAQAQARPLTARGLGGR